MSLIVTLIIGGMVGWMASIILRTQAQVEIWANVIVGVFGSYGGVLIARAMGLGPYGRSGGWLVAILGAALLTVSLRAMGVFSSSTTAR